MPAGRQSGRVFEIIFSVDAPPVQKSDVERVFRTVETAPDAACAIAAKHEFSVHDFYVFFGTVFYAKSAIHAFFHVDFEKSSVDFHCVMFNSKQKCDKVSKRYFFEFMRRKA